jgi:hypothetical protein
MATLTLDNVLYAPSVSYTLISLGALDWKGYRATIGGGHLNLITPGGTRIGRVPQSLCGLYRVLHSPNLAHAVEVVGLMELHRRLGHIAPASAHRLVESGAATGVTLAPNSREVDCDACLFARATHQPIPQLCISPPAQNFGDEIHTDVWGPAPIQS